MGSPLPLGFFAFATGIVVLSALDMQLIPEMQTDHVALVFLSFVAPLELFAAALAFLARDAAAGTTLGLFGATWVALGLSLLTGPPAGGPDPALAVFLFADAGAMLLLAATAAEAKPFLTTLLAIAVVRFVLAGLGELGIGSGLDLAGAIVGWAEAAVAFYGAFALLLEDTKHGPVLPLFRRKNAQKAIMGETGHRALEREAGVREQL